MYTIYTMKINKIKDITSKLIVVFLVLVEIVVEIRGAPVSTDIGASVLCPPPSGRCRWEPEDTCTDHSECKLNWDEGKWIGLCCPHICKGKRVCRDVRLATPSTTTESTASTTEYITTTEYTTQPGTAELSTTGVTSSSSTYPQFTTTTSSTSKTATVFKATSTAKFSSTQGPSTTETLTTTTTHPESKSTIASTTNLKTTTTPERTTEMPTTTRQTTTERPLTTKLPTTVSPTSTTLSMITTTQEPSPSVCSHSDAKNILFIIDGTVNYQQYWVTRKNEWKQTKHFIKEVVSEVNGDNFRVGIMQYGGRREPKMEVDLWEGTSFANLMYQIDNMRQIGGVERITGKALTIASDKFYELNSLYERAGAQDIVILITRGRPSDREQTFAEVEMLKQKMIRVIAIGLGPYPKYLERSLRKIASFTQDAIASKYSELANKKMDVLEKICLPVTLPATESLCGNKKYDVQFVLDGSRSINPSDFDKKRKFLKDAFFLLESPSSDLNIGIMQFSTVKKTEKVIVLQKQSLNEEFQAIKKMEYHSGRRTMLGNALSRVNDEVFNGHGGDRSAVENVLVIFSDGRAHDIAKAYREADNMKERNVRIIATTVSDYGNVPHQLRKLVTHPKYAIGIDLSNTANSAKKLVSLICQAKV